MKNIRLYQLLALVSAGLLMVTSTGCDLDGGWPFLAGLTAVGGVASYFVAISQGG